MFEGIKLDKQALQVEIESHKNKQELLRKAVSKIKHAMDVAKISLGCQSCTMLPKKAGYTCSPCLHYYCESCKDVNQEKCQECKEYVDFVFENKHIEDLQAKYIIIAEAIESVY